MSSTSSSPSSSTSASVQRTTHLGCCRADSEAHFVKDKLSAHRPITAPAKTSAARQLMHRPMTAPVAEFLLAEEAESADEMAASLRRSTETLATLCGNAKI